MKKPAKLGNGKKSMDDINYFDAHAYFKRLASLNKLAREHAFYPCSCSGINTLEDVLEHFRTEKAFVCVDDTNDTAIQCRNGSWFQRRVFTVFILIRYRMMDMTDRANKLNICRQLFRQIHSRMIVDKHKSDGDLAYLNVEDVLVRELGEYFISGCTGLYFTIDNFEPVNLCYNDEEWTED